MSSKLSAENCTVALLVATGSDCRSDTCEGESLLWFENVGKGQQDEYTVLTEITADGVLIAFGPTESVISPEVISRAYGVSARVEYCSEGIPFVLVDHEAL